MGLRLWPNYLGLSGVRLLGLSTAALDWTCMHSVHWSGHAFQLGHCILDIVLQAALVATSSSSQRLPETRLTVCRSLTC